MSGIYGSTALRRYAAVSGFTCKTSRGLCKFRSICEGSRPLLCLGSSKKKEQVFVVGTPAQVKTSTCAIRELGDGEIHDTTSGRCFSESTDGSCLGIYSESQRDMPV